MKFVGNLPWSTSLFPFWSCFNSQKVRIPDFNNYVDALLYKYVNIIFKQNFERFSVKKIKISYVLIYKVNKMQLYTYIYLKQKKIYHMVYHKLYQMLKCFVTIIWYDIWCTIWYIIRYTIKYIIL